MRITFGVGTLMSGAAVIFSAVTAGVNEGWNWKNILNVVMGATSVVAGFGALFSACMKSSKGWSTVSKGLMKFSAAISCLVSIIFSVTAIIEGVKLKQLGQHGKGNLIITIAVLNMVSAVLGFLSMFFPVLLPVQIFIELVTAVLQFFLAQADDPTTECLKALKNRHPNLDVWTDSESLPMGDIAVYQVNFPGRNEDIKKVEYVFTRSEVTESG